MIRLDLQDDEQQALSEALKSYLGDLSFEIANTDKMSFRDQLKTNRDLLQKILDTLDNA